jgi:RNA 3'-terminal phosphate cyclase (GTP)
MIEIDGSFGEGGGQIIRTSLGLSALTNQPCKIFNIRKGRPNPGLQPQHLTAVNALAEICDAGLSGACLRSEELVFNPDKITGGEFSWDVQTAGSVTLVLQALLPAAACSRKSFVFNIRGGTNVPWSPSFEHLKRVFCYYLSGMGIKIKVDLLSHGFYPKGGGFVKLTLSPSELRPLNLDNRGDFEKIDIWSIASSDLRHANVAERQVKGFKNCFVDLKIGKIHEVYVESACSGSSIHAHAHFTNCKLGAQALGAPKKSAENVGTECAKNLIAELQSSSAADSHTFDQLLPYIAIVGGSLRFREMTSHAKTNIWVIEKFLPVKFVVKGDMISVDRLNHC